MLHERGQPEAGDSAIRRAFLFHPNDLSPFIRLAKKLRQEDAACKPASTLYELMLTRAPRRGDVRSGYIACAVWLGDYAGARKAAEDGIESGIDVDVLRTAVVIIDSATTHHAPAGSVRLPHLKGGWFDVGQRDSLP